MLSIESIVQQSWCPDRSMIASSRDVEEWIGAKGVFHPTGAVFSPVILNPKLSKVYISKQSTKTRASRGGIGYVL